jgi:spore coat protein CotF
MQLTQKEMMYLKDAKSQEELCVAKYTNYSQQVSCQQLSSMLKQIGQHEQKHLQTVQQIMQGQMPNVSSSGGQQQGMQFGQLSAQQGGGGSMSMQASGGGQGQQQQHMQHQMQAGHSGSGMSSSMGGQPLNDKQICEDLLTTEKAVAGLYNTATFEFTNPQLRQVLAHIQQEEQDHAYQLYNYMAQKGWYQAQ